jgi:hypothetical protein
VALRRIDELRRSGCSFREIASRLDAEGLAPRRAGAWSPMAVRNIVTRSGPATK